MAILSLLLGYGAVSITLAVLIHVLIELLVLVLIGWIILWILREIGAPPLARKIVLVIGALIAILILVNLILPLA